ncbi:fimbrillin family protein, partial [Bacteroides thetaiotaomicron]
MTHRFWKHRGRAVIAACTLLLAVGLGGCSTDHVTDPDGVDNSRTIRFTPAVKSSGVPGTRAAAGHPIENGKNIPSGGSFGVYAYYRLNSGSTASSYAAELANNTKVTNSGTAFTYSPIAKWPGQAGEQLAFYGYYPWQDPSTTPVAGDPVIAATPIAANAISLSYTTPADPAKHVDLMYAYTPFTGGFAPVNMEFHHALTRVNFKGKVEDYTVPVQITSITVKKVKSKAALMTIFGSSNTYWTAPNTDTNMVLTPGNGLVANPILTSTLSWVSQPGSTSETAGDLLVIPQSVQGMEVVVEAMIDGSPETFTFPLKDTPDWVMNQIVTYEITISGSGMRLVARFSADWNDNAIGVIEDGQWWMYVEEDDLVLSMGGGSETVHAETNYDISSQGYPAGLSVEVPSQYGSWLSVAASGSPGDLTRSFVITATPTSTARTGEVHITAGNLTKIVKVSQSIARQFARSNIVWDATNNKLTFAVTEADNATIPANSQGVFFKWGSLVAVSPVGNTYAANQILFSPSGTTNYNWANIPY